MWSKCGTYDPLRTSVCVISISIPIAALCLTVLAGLSFAGDTMVQADNGLRITSTASVLSQAEASTAAGVQGPQSVTVANTTTTAPAAAVPDPREAAWFSGFHLSGYVGQTFGTWQNPSALRDFTPSRNNLAVSRTAVQFDENFRLNETNSFFMREWFVYEPPYSWDSANIPVYNAVNADLPNHPSYGHFMNDWYNQYTVRDAWWENKSGPLTTYIGNQIVVWGQSLAFRVGDVINPVDTSWAFGFANLENLMRSAMDDSSDSQPAGRRAPNLEFSGAGCAARVRAAMVVI